MSDPTRRRWLSELADMPQERFERLGWRLVILIGIAAGALLLLVFIGMIIAGAVMMGLAEFV